MKKSQSVCVFEGEGGKEGEKPPFSRIKTEMEISGDTFL